MICTRERGKAWRISCSLKPATLLLLIAGVAAPLCLPLAFFHSHAAGWSTLGVMAAAHAVLLYATLRPNNRIFGPVISRFTPAQGNEVWLTIDDGPDPADTPRLLDLLDAHGARATFFVRGDRARAHPDLVAEIVRRGHGLGNHTFHHPQATFWCLGPGRLRREIGGCSDTLRELTGRAPTLFRAPVGMVNPFVHAAAARSGLRLVGWSARGFDGVRAHASDPAAVVRRIMDALQPGGIALLHEGRRGPAGEAVNVRAVAGLLAALDARGWRAVLPEVDG